MRISKLKYKDWGRLSKEFLTEVYNVDKNTGELQFNIIHALWQTMIILWSCLAQNTVLNRADKTILTAFRQGKALRNGGESLYFSCGKTTCVSVFENYA